MRRRGQQGDLVAYLSIGDGIPVKATGRYVRAEPDVDWPEGVEDLEIFSEDTGESVPEEDLSESDEALAVEALIEKAGECDA